MVTKEKIIQFFRQLPGDEHTRDYEKNISRFAYDHASTPELTAYTQIMQSTEEYAYEAFFCLATIHRHNRDFTKLWKLINKAKEREDLRNHVSFSHIEIMYATHSESLYDYDELLESAHRSACDLFDNSGYQHTFANAFATICEKCLPADLSIIVDTWYDTALYCVNRAIALEPDYAKYYCTKARIVSVKHHFEEANDLILKAIDLEDSKKHDYALLVGNYQYFRIMIAMRKQQWLMGGKSPEKAGEPFKDNKDKQKTRNTFQQLRPYAFISYSHNDTPTINTILSSMTRQGFNYWYDHELKAGSNWTEELGEKILNAAVVVVFLSNSAILSRNVRNEITMAQNHKKKIIPVFLEEVELSPGAELQLQGYQWLLMHQVSTEAFQQKLFEELDNCHTRNDDQSTNSSPSLSQGEGAGSSPSGGLTFGKRGDGRGVSEGIPIIEQLCSSKTSNPDDNEDMLVVTGEYIAIIDGATSKTQKRFEGKTGGRIAAELIAHFISDGQLDTFIDGKTAIYRLQAVLSEFANKYNLEEQGIHLCASTVIYSVAKRQIWAVGDCQFILNGKRHTFYKKVDEVLSEARALAIHMLLQSGYTEEDLQRDDTARELIMGQLRLQQNLENRDDEFGYSVLSSHGTAKAVSITDVPPGSEIILASDGYPELFTTLAESETRLNELIRLDPLCYKIFKSTKGLTEGCTHFDDRTYIRFRIG